MKLRLNPGRRSGNSRLSRGIVIAGLSLLMLGACSSSDDGDSDGTADGAGDADAATAFAFLSGATPLFDAGQIERISIGETIQASGTYPATMSDIRVRTDGTDVYQVGRLDIETITRFRPDEFTTPVYQYSLLQGETSPNTFDIIFASDTKAYVLQFESSEIVIVNPSAETEDEFITGSIDISAYDTDAPNAAAGVIANGRLFVLMARLTGFAADKPGFVAVFDVATDTEVATGMNDQGLNGIALNTLNPVALQYIESTDDILVTGRGNIFGDPAVVEEDLYTGGIEVIDASTFTLDMLVEDGTEDNNEGFFGDSIQASDERGYIITSTGFRDNTLRSYNVLTGLLEEGVIAGLEGMDLSALGVGPEGRLWVGIGGNEPGFVLINPADNSIAVEKVATEFIPNQIVFTEVAP